MDGNADFLLQRADQLPRGVRFAQAGHVLDGKDVRAHAFDFLRLVDIIFQRILVALLVVDVAGVTDCRFAEHLAMIACGFHGHLHVGQVVERVEDPEDVHAGVRRVFHETGDHIVRIVRVTDCVRATEEHLEAEVRDLFAQAAEAIPGTFGKEAHRRVEGGAAPHFQREELGHPVGHGLGHAQHVIGAHAGGDERLVGVAQRGVCDEQAFLVQNPLAEALGAFFQQHIARTHGHFRVVLDDKRVRHMRLGHGGGRFPSLGARISVERDVREIRQRAGGAVAADAELEQLGLGINELGVRLAGAEGFVGDDVFEERNVGLHASDAELAQGPVHALAGHRKIAAHRRDLHQHRVIIRRDDRTGIACGGIKTDAETRGRAVVEDAAVIGREILLRILGGDTALNGESIAGDLVLLRNGYLHAVQRLALRDEDLRADEIDAGHTLGDGVLDLDARVHFDEEPFVAVHVIKKLDGARVVVADAFGKRHGRVAEFLAHLRIEVHRGRDLDNFLIAALHRAVALMKVDDIAVLVAEDLHLDVLGARNVPLEENRGISEGLLRLGLRFCQQAGELRGFFHHAHAAATTAEGRLDDERETDLMRHGERLVGIGDRVFRARQGGHLVLVRQSAGRRLVAHVFQ